eukprot:gnl/MRDRNA2_/MRDRNA2_35946_c0_seq1.p1 gnl/MRDRNA2_/MRDRNA2_35946_c0~~gnl/MRDRNA2_/MRDRNA2_35946_c0_seq1.p1  ORF type:complete len:408 (-),score=57.44 gnl/MRDRNA2_/MRDRNA2_35946_c0_seq1:279-1349(-)
MVAFLTLWREGAQKGKATHRSGFADVPFKQVFVACVLGFSVVIMIAVSWVNHSVAAKEGVVPEFDWQLFWQTVGVDSTADFDWWSQASPVGGLLTPYVKGQRVLQVGCGLSPLAGILSQEASSVVNIDVSEEVVQAMKQAYANSSNSEFYAMDVFDMPDNWEPFDTIVDKAAAWDLHRNSASELRQLLCVMRHLLHPGGFYAVVTSGTLKGMQKTLELIGKSDAPSLLAYFPLASAIDASKPLPTYAAPDVPLGMYLFQFGRDMQRSSECSMPANQRKKVAKPGSELIESEITVLKHADFLDKQIRKSSALPPESVAALLRGIRHIRTKLLIDRVGADIHARNRFARAATLELEEL